MLDCQTMLPSVTQLLESSQHLAITWLRWEVAGRPASWLPCPFAPEAAGAGEMGVAQTFSWHVLPKVSFQERKRRDRTDHWFPLLTYCTTKKCGGVGDLHHFLLGVFPGNDQARLLSQGICGPAISGVDGSRSGGELIV